MGNKAHLRPHRKKRQASLTTGLLLVILFIALVALAVAMVANGHALPAGRIFPLRRGPLCSGFKACPLRSRSRSHPRYLTTTYRPKRARTGRGHPLHGAAVTGKLP